MMYITGTRPGSVSPCYTCKFGNAMEWMEIRGTQQVKAVNKLKIESHIFECDANGKDTGKGLMNPLSKGNM